MRKSLPSSPSLTSAAELEPQWRTACGCREGFLGLLAGLALFTRNYVASYGVEFSLSRTIFAGIAFGLCGAVAGKILGLAWAHFRYKSLRSQVSAPLAREDAAKKLIRPLS